MLKVFRHFVYGTVVLLLIGCQTMGASWTAHSALDPYNLKMQEATRCLDKYKTDYAAQTAIIYERMLTGKNDPLMYAKLASEDPISDEFIQAFLHRLPIVSKCYLLQSQAFTHVPAYEHVDRIYRMELEKINLQLIQRKYATYGEFVLASYEARLRAKAGWNAVSDQLNERSRVAQQIDINQRSQSAQSFSQGVNQGFNQMLQMQQNMNQRAEQQRQLRQQQNNQSTNCSTKYNRYSKAWDTVCR